MQLQLIQILAISCKTKFWLSIFKISLSTLKSNLRSIQHFHISLNILTKLVRIHKYISRCFTKFRVCLPNNYESFHNKYFMIPVKTIPINLRNNMYLSRTLKLVRKCVICLGQLTWQCMSNFSKYIQYMQIPDESKAS